MGDPRAYLCVTPTTVKQHDISSLTVLFQLKMHSEHVPELALLY